MQKSNRVHIGCVHLIVAIERLSLHKVHVMWVRTHPKGTQPPRGWHRETLWKGLTFLFAVDTSTAARPFLLHSCGYSVRGARLRWAFTAKQVFSSFGQVSTEVSSVSARSAAPCET